ncbi:hypothetical protein MD484_g658, partial [Candolleomyces efflorescens]
MQSSLSRALLILSALVAASWASSVSNARRDASDLVPRQASSPDALATERALAFAQKYSPSDLLVSSPAVPVASSVSRRSALAKRQDSSLSPEELAIESARIFAEKYSPNDVRNATTTSEAVERREAVEARAPEASPDVLAVERARAFAERFSPNDVAE